MPSNSLMEVISWAGEGCQVGNVKSADDSERLLTSPDILGACQGVDVRGILAV